MVQQPTRGIHRSALALSVAVGALFFVMLQVVLLLGMSGDRVTPVVFALALAQHVIIDRYSPSGSVAVNTVILLALYLVISATIGLPARRVAAFERHPLLFALAAWIIVEVAAWRVAQALVTAGMIAVE